MKLTKKKNGKGYLSGYTIGISISDAKQCNFVDEEGNTKELKKTIKNKKIIIELNDDKIDFNAFINDDKIWK